MLRKGGHGHAPEGSLRANGVPRFLLLTLLCAGWGRAEESPGWWNEAWSHRIQVRLVGAADIAKVKTGFVRLAREQAMKADLSDVRMVAAGNEIPFQATPYGEHELGVEFQLVGAEGTDYAVYFGNQDAPPVQHALERTTGGIYLETYRNQGPHPHNWLEMKDKLDGKGERFGGGWRKQIHDFKNPFGPHDQYISVYRGHLFCPAEGTYGFATQSDDASFLFVDGILVAQWTGEHVRIEDWSHKGYVSLAPGIHSIEYYHEEGWDRQAAVAGWVPPTSNRFEIIPEEAFVLLQRADPVERERLGSSLKPFFEAEVLGCYRLNDADAEFASVRFLQRSEGQGETAWEFGDGQVSNEEEPLHVYRKRDNYRVTLTLRSPGGETASYARTLDLTRLKAMNRRVWLDVETEKSFLYQDEAMALVCLVANDHEVDLSLSLRLFCGNQELCDAERVVPPAGEWKTSLSAPNPQAGKDFRVELRHAGAVLASTEAFLASVDKLPDAIDVRGFHLRSEDNRALCVLLDGAEGASEASPKDAPLSKRDVLWLDDCLAPSPGRGDLRSRYYDLVLKDSAHSTPEDGTRHIGIVESIEGDPWLLRLMRAREALREDAPAWMVVCYRVDDTEEYVSLKRWRRGMEFLLHLARSSGVRVLLSAPPPSVLSPEKSKRVALATKQLGLDWDLPVADLYSAFLLRKEGWTSLYSQGEDGFLYYKFPREEGQRVIAEEISNWIEK